jgi:hypothetical protein
MNLHIISLVFTQEETQIFGVLLKMSSYQILGDNNIINKKTKWHLFFQIMVFAAVCPTLIFQSTYWTRVLRNVPFQNATKNNSILLTYLTGDSIIFFPPQETESRQGSLWFDGMLHTTIINEQCFLRVEHLIKEKHGNYFYSLFWTLLNWLLYYCTPHQ